MYWGSMSDQQIEGLVNLVHNVTDSELPFDLNSDILNNIELSWFQCFCVEHCFISKGTLVSLDTGLGKTMVGMAYIKRVLDSVEQSKGLFFCLPESVEQILGDFEEYSDLNVIAISGESHNIQALRQFPVTSYDVVIVSYQALYSREFCNWLVSHMDFMSVVVFDEAHTLSQESLINHLIKPIINRIEYRMMLTATAITVSPEQPIELLDMFDSSFIPEGKKVLSRYEVRNPQTFELEDYTDLDDFTHLLYPRYVSWTRAELGMKGNYKPKLYLVKPTDEQREATAKDGYKIIKGDRESNQVKTLLAILMDKTKRYKRGLVYVYNIDLANMLYDEITKLGIKVAVANGEPEHKIRRQQIIHDYVNGEYDCLLTNLTTSLNLSSDYVIFYQNTNKAMQMIGRAERGFLPVDLEIDYILTEDTVEIEQFYKNVYRRSKWMGHMLQKDTEIFERFKRALDRI